jgi:hypothetical protein
MAIACFLFLTTGPPLPECKAPLPNSSITLVIFFWRIVFFLGIWFPFGLDITLGYFAKFS